MLVDVLQESGLAKSKSEARRLIEQGAVSIDEVKIIDPEFNLTIDDITNEVAILRKGKKNLLVLYKN